MQSSFSSGFNQHLVHLMKKIAFMTPPDADLGFSLAGVPQYVVDANEAESTLKEITAGPENGLIMIDERLMQGIPEERVRELEKSWSGILLVMPSPIKPSADVEDYAARLIRRAIGYHVRLKL